MISREIKSRPSTGRSAFVKDRYLKAPLMVDIEYIHHLTLSHQSTGGMEARERETLPGSIDPDGIP